MNFTFQNTTRIQPLFRAKNQPISRQVFVGRDRASAFKMGDSWLMTKRQPKLSLCMIVKNEQRWLEDCLNSVKDLVDEMIIVDTGSQDNTVEIAHRFGAKVFDHPWNGDFSEARNHSLGYATGDWILVLDADERLALARCQADSPFDSQYPRRWLSADATELSLECARCQFHSQPARL